MTYSIASFEAKQKELFDDKQNKGIHNHKFQPLLYFKWSSIMVIFALQSIGMCLFYWFYFSWITFKLARNKAYSNQYFDFRDNIVSMDIYFDQMSYTVLKQLKAMDESSLLSK